MFWWFYELLCSLSHTNRHPGAGLLLPGQRGRWLAAALPRERRCWRQGIVCRAKRSLYGVSGKTLLEFGLWAAGNSCSCVAPATCCYCLWNFWPFSPVTRGNGLLKRLLTGNSNWSEVSCRLFLPRLQFVCFLLLFFCLQLRWDEFTRRISYPRAGNSYQHTCVWIK